MRCDSCGSVDTDLWAHNAGVGTHHWGEKSEGDCTCQPQRICTNCDAPLLKQHGFIVLDAVCFGFTNDTLQ